MEKVRLWRYKRPPYFSTELMQVDEGFPPPENVELYVLTKEGWQYMAEQYRKVVGETVNDVDPREPRLHPVVDVFGEAQDLISDKAHDYAEDENVFSNFEGVAEMVGITVEDVIFAHIVNKVERLRQLRSKGQARNESARDSLMDLGNYAFLLVAYLDQ